MICPLDRWMVSFPPHPSNQSNTRTHHKQPAPIKMPRSASLGSGGAGAGRRPLHHHPPPSSTTTWARRPAVAPLSPTWLLSFLGGVALGLCLSLFPPHPHTHHPAAAAGGGRDGHHHHHHHPMLALADSRYTHSIDRSIGPCHEGDSSFGGSKFSSTFLIACRPPPHLSSKAPAVVVVVVGPHAQRARGRCSSSKKGRRSAGWQCL